MKLVRKQIIETNIPVLIIGAGSGIGNEVLNIPHGHICCGSAGTYNLLQTKIAQELLKNKILNIEKIKPQIISTGNIGCITHIANATKIPILHTVEIIDWYTGGPIPQTLEKL